MILRSDNSTRHRIASAQSGFTLVEALAVIAILAIVTAFMMPAMMRKPDHLILRETVQQIRQMLHLARSTAITTSSESVFFIDLNERRFGLQNLSTRDMPHEISVSFKIAESERLAASRGGIRFFQDGSSTGGELRFELNGKTTVLCVHWLLGRPVEAESC